MEESMSILDHGMHLWKVRYKGRIRGLCVYRRKYKLSNAKSLPNIRYELEKCFILKEVREKF